MCLDYKFLLAYEINRMGRGTGEKKAETAPFPQQPNPRFSLL
jgi:hypothetical protein